MQIRRMNEKDASRLAEIEEKCFSLPWSEQAFLDALQHGNALIIVAEEEDTASTILGYVCMYVAVDEGEITNVAVNPMERKRGIASRLMEEIHRQAKQMQLNKIFLEVRKSNLPAQELYKKYAYEEVGIRKNFYQKPTEDAIVMMVDLQNERHCG